MDLQLDNQSIASDLTILPETKSYMLTMVKWTKFLSIFGFISIGLYSLYLIWKCIQIGLLNDYVVLYTTIYTLAINTVYFFILKHLFVSSGKIKLAIELEDSDLLTEGLGFLRKHFKILGIFTIVILGFIALMLLIALIGGAAMLMR